MDVLALTPRSNRTTKYLFWVLVSVLAPGSSTFRPFLLPFFSLVLAFRNVNSVSLTKVFGRNVRDIIRLIGIVTYLIWTELLNVNGM